MTTELDEIDRLTKSGEYWLQPCDSSEPHRRHLTVIAHCDHEVDKWCLGVPEPGSIEEKVAELQPGQRVLVIMEGVVQPPTDYPSDHGCRRAVVLHSPDPDGGREEHTVLRYTGSHPASARSNGRHAVDGQINSAIVSLKVLPD